MDKKSFLAAMAMLAGVFNRPITNEVAEGYWVALQDLAEVQLRAAVARALRESKFMPSPAELRDLAGAGGTSALVAEIAAAWDAVMGAKRKHDYTTSVDFGPLVNSVIRSMGGWMWFCDQSRDQLAVWVRKRFDELYAALKANPLDANRGAPLRGEFPGEPVRIAIAGMTPPMRQIESGARNGISDVVRGLANEKAAR